MTTTPKPANKNLILATTTCVALTLSTLTVSEDSWWQKGMKTLETVEKLKPSAAETTDKTTHSSDLNIGDIAGAFKDALKIGSEKVVSQLQQENGFNTDPTIHIPLPDELMIVKNTLAKVGLSTLTDELELKLNRAAEAATPKAKALFWQAIKEMTFDDAMAIYNGPEDSATNYFKEKMSSSLQTEMHPVINETLASVGAIQAYDAVIGKYQAMPFVPNVKADLTNYVSQKGVDGIFHYLGKEEAAIRKDPARQTTDLLKQVFGAM